MRIILLILIISLSGCYSSKITKENAMSECFLYNVVCDGRKVRTDGIEPIIKIVGKNIDYHCPEGVLGCYHATTNTIYVKHNDGRVINHEKMHHYFKTARHKRQRLKFTSPIASAKDR